MTNTDTGGTDLLERIEETTERAFVEDGDQERFSHYVPRELILESALTGKPVKALCGKLWTPSRDPEKFPICPDCVKVYESMPK
ncbi:DUF3039 domain-containing protein [Leucobacter sp. cx-169]|uniref:DUF3039 domain-containing protein n=1 Tax=Leucobacter sp. cx-169 TaxID=2770549 RepID=UPI00165DE7A5|nr:DUF3039 domain-containing protein [Leucobacter sp. cx-169]MBC9927302.1 DUF3039 domain-containing protein [Leucobacter sp. cx-169]